MFYFYLICALLEILCSSAVLENDLDFTRQRQRREATKNNVNSTNCPESFLGKCTCKMQKYPRSDSPEQFVVNCTDSHFTDADMLEDIPLE